MNGAKRSMEEPLRNGRVRSPLNGRVRGRIAILIDDIGWDLPALRNLLALDADLTYAVLPQLETSREAAMAIMAVGREVLMHLPMEPHAYPALDPGKGALLKSMSSQRLQKNFLENLRTVPMLVGINNHMGSRFTEDRRLMRQVLKLIKRQGLFFVDSVTSPDSVAFHEAKRLGLRTVKRQVFLDHDVDYAATVRQLNEAAQVALQRGKALAIGHPHPTTIRAIADMLPRLRRRGLRIVRVSAIID